VQAIITQVVLAGRALLEKLAAPLGEPVPHIRDSVGIGPVISERSVGDLRQCAERVHGRTMRRPYWHRVVRVQDRADAELDRIMS
jgi:hypothetical protein